MLSEAKGEFKVMGVRSSKDKKYNSFWKHWHNTRTQQHKRARMIFTDKNTPYWDTMKEMTYTQVRSISTLSPSAIMIVDSTCFIFSYEEEFTCIQITSTPIAKSFDSFFESLWSMAKP